MIKKDHTPLLQPWVAFAFPTWHHLSHLLPPPLVRYTLTVHIEVAHPKFFDVMSYRLPSCHPWLRRFLCHPTALPVHLCPLKAQAPNNSKTLICDMLTIPPPLPHHRAASTLIRSAPLLSAHEEDNQVRWSAQLHNKLAHEHKEKNCLQCGYKYMHL
jgi:hypothetical protein